MGLDGACTTLFIGCVNSVELEVCIVFIMYVDAGCVYFVIELTLGFARLWVGFWWFCGYLVAG